MFIKVQVDQSRFSTKSEREMCARVCPCDVLRAGEDELTVDPANEDECIFCDLCVQNAPPDGVKVVKTYEEWITKR